MHAWEPKEGTSAGNSSALASASGAPANDASTSAASRGAALAHREQAMKTSEQPWSSASASTWTNYVPQGLIDMVSSLQEGEGVAGLSQTQTLAAAAGAVVLLYAGALTRCPGEAQ